MDALVEVGGLRVVARKEGRETPIVKDVGFSIPKGQVLALIGESGSGKSLTALAIMGLLPGDLAPAGSVVVTGQGPGGRGAGRGA
mgnify:CR=1 FL=1